MMDGHEDPPQEGSVPKDDDSYPLIVDSGEDTTLQVGDRNLMVISHLPGTAEDPSELGEDNPDCSSLPANVINNSSVHLDEHNQTKRKEVSPTTPGSIELNIPFDEQPNIQDLLGMGQQLGQLQVDMSSPEQCIDTMTRDVAVATDKIYVFDKQTQTNINVDQSEDEKTDNDGDGGSNLTQIGHNNMVVHINIDKAVLEEARQRGEVTVRPKTGPIITLTWKGESDAVSSEETLRRTNEIIENRQMQRDMSEQMLLTRTEMDRNANEMREVKNMLMSIMLQSSQPKSGTDPLSQMLGQYAAKYIPQSTQFPIAMETIIESIKTNPSIRAQNGNELMAERKGNPRDAASGIFCRLHSSLQASTKACPKKSRSQIFDAAERLLSSLNVASVGRSSTNKEVKRLANAVAEALIDDDPPPPRSKTLDTLLCLDVSESIGAGGIEDVKRIAIDFVNRIEEIAEQYGLKENLGVIALGAGARIVQQLTNDYNLVRGAIEALSLGGRTPIFEALIVCIAAIKGRGGVLSIGGAHNIRPRIIFITDGLETDYAFETGRNIPSTDRNTKIQLVRLVSELSPKEHSLTPNPIIWVPVGNANRSFLAFLAKLGGGMLVEGNVITTLCSYYRIQEYVGKVYICVKHHEGEWANLDAIEAVADALVGDMTPEQKREVIQAVQHKLENKDKKKPDSDPNDYEHIHEVKDLPPIGTRVIRGPDWKYDYQDAGGPGTVINHAKDENFLWVLWDLNSTVCRYRFGLGGKYDVFQADDQPRILMHDELIEIGVKVKRGPDWSYNGGRQGNIGVVIRKRKDGKVKVRWPNGTINSCRYGYNGKFDLEICSIDELIPATQEQSTAQGGHVTPTAEKPHVLWQWKDDLGQWRLYDRKQIAKLNKEFDQRPGGCCLLQNHGMAHRVMFREMAEKCLKDGTKRDARRIVVGDEERDEHICVEMALNEGFSWDQ